MYKILLIFLKGLNQFVSFLLILVCTCKNVNTTLSSLISGQVTDYSPSLIFFPTAVLSPSLLIAGSIQRRQTHLTKKTTTPLLTGACCLCAQKHTSVCEMNATQDFIIQLMQ